LRLALTYAAVLLPAAQNFEEKFHVPGGQTIMAKVVHGLPFDRDRWKLVVGEILLFAAAEVPEIEVVPETMLCLLAADDTLTRRLNVETSRQSSNAHAGARDLDFGGKVYRPEKAVTTYTPDVDRVASYLGAQQPER